MSSLRKITVINLVCRHLKWMLTIGAPPLIGQKPNWYLKAAGFYLQEYAKSGI